MLVANVEPDEAPNPSCCSDPTDLCRKCSMLALVDADDDDFSANTKSVKDLMDESEQTQRPLIPPSSMRRTAEGNESQHSQPGYLGAAGAPQVNRAKSKQRHLTIHRKDYAKK